MSLLRPTRWAIFSGGDTNYLILTALILFCGLFFLGSAAWPLGYDRFGNGYYFLIHQLIFGLLPGVMAFIIATQIPTGFYSRWAGLAYLITIALLFAVFIPGLGADFGSSKSWISLGSLSFQPSELVKLTFLIYLGAWLSSRTLNERASWRFGFWPFAIAIGTVMLALFLQPDTGTMVILGLIGIAVYFLAGGPIKYFFLTLLLGIFAIWILLTVVPKFSDSIPLLTKLEYRTERFTTFLHPELDPLGQGYHINQALLAVGTGGWFGRGFGHSLQKFSYLPEVAGDSIFAVIAEELGFIITSLFLIVYAFWVRRAFQIASLAKTDFSRYVGCGIAVGIGLQSLINIGAMLGLLPITGVPWPLISYGGTALMVSLFSVGLIWRISLENNPRAPIL